MTKVVLPILLFVMFAGLKAQQRFAVEFGDQSEISILGSTNVIPFKLSQKVITFTGKRRTFTVNTAGGKVRFAENKIDIPVSMFDSDNKMALRDFKKLIQVEEYPEIRMTLNHINASLGGSSTKKIHATANVDLTITGQTKSYSIPFETEQNDANKIQLKGNKRISIRDFGLEPPVAMMGLIKVSEWIDIQFSTDCIVRKI